MNACKCRVPANREDPRFTNTCRKCGMVLDAGWDQTDENLNKFLSMLPNCFGGAPPDWVATFAAQCKEREQAGRSSFGYAYLDRDNTREGQEEAEDGAIYAYLEILRNKRDGVDDQYDLALTAAHHFAKAWNALAQMRHKTDGGAA